MGDGGWSARGGHVDSSAFRRIMGCAVRTTADPIQNPGRRLARADASCVRATAIPGSSPRRRLHQVSLPGRGSVARFFVLFRRTIVFLWAYCSLKKNGKRLFSVNARNRYVRTEIPLGNRSPPSPPTPLPWGRSCHAISIKRRTGLRSSSMYRKLGPARQAQTGGAAARGLSSPKEAIEKRSKIHRRGRSRCSLEANTAALQ